MTQRIKEQIGAVPAIETELHLFEVGREMLRAQTMPRSSYSPLEERERRFDSVGMNVSHDIHAGTVVNLFVVRPLSFPHGGIIRGSVISEDYFHVLADILADVLGERSPFRITGVEEAKVAVALADAYDHFLVVILCDMTLTAHLSADIGHVHLNFSVEHGFVGLRHSVPDAVAEIPRCLVAADSKRALNLAGRHAFLCFAEQKGGSKPRCERQVRIIENCSSGDGELIVTVFAIEEMLFGFQFDHWAFAAQAARAFWEAQARQEFAALGIGREERVYVH